MLRRDRTRSPSGVREFHTPPTVLNEEVEYHRQQKWNEPKGNIARVVATFWCFILLGSNDSLYGVILPYLEIYYGVSYLEISLVFLSPVIGFIISTLSNHSIHTRFGRRGVILIAGICHIVAYTIASQHPPFFALVLVYAIVGMGCGAKQAAWNSFIGGLPNELLGLLHGCYGIGATLTPVIASSLISKSGWQWFMVYYILISMAVLDFVFSISVFGKQSSKEYNKAHPVELNDRGAGNPTNCTAPSQSLKQRAQEAKIGFKNSYTVQCLRTKVVIICSCFLLSYVGSEVSLGGWLVTFMIKVRHGSAFAASLTSSGLWAGITLGRIALGFVTGRFFKSEKHAVVAYLMMAMVMELLFWLIPSFVASAVSVAFLGFFLGPLFPGVIICISRLVPRSLQVSAIGICSAIGASGASIVPFTIGAIAQAKGVEVLQPIILALLGLCLLLWIFLPKLSSPVGSN